MEVSVVLCTYNGAKFIAGQLDSILQQTHPLREILVFDDHSSDDTFRILEEYQAKYPLVKVHRNDQNMGFTRNFEQAIKAASGEAIAISDQDDVWVNTKLEKMINAWKKDCPLIYCRSYYFTNELPEDPRHPSNYIRFDGTDGRKLFYYNTISGHALIVRKEFLRLVFPFKEGVMYDWWMAVVAAYNGGVQHFPEILVYQRVHEGNITVASKKVTTKNRVSRHNAEAIKHNKAFIHAPNIPAGDKAFSERFISLLENNKTGKVNIPLLRFLVKYRRIIFYHKRKPFDLISHFKHSYRIAKY